MGMIPFSEAPIAAPTMHDSASGVSMQRSSPNSATKPSVARKTPPSPTSSPRTMIRSSRFISSNMATWIATTIFFSAIGGSPFNKNVTYCGLGFGRRFLLDFVGRLSHLVVHADVQILLGVVVDGVEIVDGHC